MHQSTFPENVLAEAEIIKVEFEKLQSRNYIETITIDGTDSRDLDDAISMEYHPDKFIVHISVSDVSEYILPGSSLFNEALKRVSTQYFSHKNIPMLPAVLSEDTLSLLDMQKRPALTFSITLTRDLEIVNIEISETIIFNRRRLNYAQVDYILDSCPDDPDYQLLNDCYILARRLMDKRRKQGALVIFDIQQLIYTNEEGMLIRMTRDDAHKSNIIIQEFMILANMAAAQVAAERDFIILFRNHTTRLNTPGREEILEQLQSAVLNNRLLENLIKRSGLWFNKAAYETKLKGHYGLNLPAYSHFTSPLRRVTDLINHIMLKAQLFARPVPFCTGDIDNMAMEINNFLIDAQQEKKNICKEISKQQIIEQVAIIDIDKFALCNNKELKSILKELCRSNVLSSELENVLITRIKESRMGVEHLEMILFDTPESDEKWKPLKDIALETVLKSPGFGLQILYIKNQSGLLSDLKIEVLDNNGLFDSRIICRIKGNELSTTNYFTGNSKKEAQHSAANGFIKGYFSDQLVLSSETKRDTTLSNVVNINNYIIPDEEICEENFIGKLNELCSSRNYSLPQFEFTQAGPVHAPIFNCHCKIQIGNKTKKAMASSSTKQNAKQLSAKIIFEILSDNSSKSVIPGKVLPKNQEIPLPIFAAEISKENYIGCLLELCRKSHYPEPIFTFSQAGTQHQPVFSCIATLKLHKNALTGTGIGTNKKDAKHNAAKKLIEQFEVIK